MSVSAGAEDRETRRGRGSPSNEEKKLIAWRGPIKLYEIDGSDSLPSSYMATTWSPLLLPSPAYDFFFLRVPPWHFSGHVDPPRRWQLAVWSTFRPRWGPFLSNYALMMMYVSVWQHPPAPDIFPISRFSQLVLLCDFQVSAHPVDVSESSFCIS